MRVKEIRILGLFGMFDHVIPLNLDTHLSIIYGINGIGKTTIFKMLDYFFNIEKGNNISNLAKIVFNELSIEFTNNTVITVLNKEKNLEITLKKENEVPSFWPLSLENLEKQKQETKGFKGLKLIDLLANKAFEFPKELSLFLKSINLFFIQTQRLFIFSKKSDAFDEKESIYTYTKTSVEQYSKSISYLIKKKREEYEKLSETLQLSLGKRMSNKEINTNLDKEELHQIVVEVEQKRAELKAVGLLENTEEENFEIADDLEAVPKAVLSVNLQDMKTKLKVFDDLYTKLATFLDILNERRLSYKKIVISEKEGFTFVNDNHTTLQATDLSSGEQHELILLYLLLFRVSENSLILIDEPEISLHISWQKDFIEDMKDIIKLRNFDILVATHSPAIVNGQWDELTINLNGKNGKNE
jgi:predicted ATP-binding protein involved in virulence